MGARRVFVNSSPETPPRALLLALLPIEARRLGANAESVAMSEAFERYLFHRAPVEAFAKPGVAIRAVATHVEPMMDVDTPGTEELSGQLRLLAESERPLDCMVDRHGASSDSWRVPYRELRPKS